MELPGQAHTIDHERPTRREEIDSTTRSPDAWAGGVFADFHRRFLLTSGC